MHVVVELGDSFSQGLDTRCGTVLSAGHGDVDGLGSGEASLDVILNLRGTLTEVGPEVGFLEVAILGGSLCAPDDTGG